MNCNLKASAEKFIDLSIYANEFIDQLIDEKHIDYTWNCGKVLH